MTATFKSSIRTLAHRLARVPSLARLVHIATGFYHLPDIRRDLFLMRQAASYTSQNPADRANAFRDNEVFRNHSVAVEERIAALEAAWRQQFPAALDAMATLNHKMSDFDNAIRSYPHAMREMTRQHQSLLESTTRLEEHGAARHDAVALRLSALEQQMLAATSTLATHGAALDESSRRLDSSVADVGELRAKIDQAHGAAQAISTDLQTKFASALERIVPLENRDSRNAQMLDQTNATLSYLLGRVEFVRRELMFELRYGSGAGRLSEGQDVEPKIVNQEKVDKARTDGLRVNLGSGHIPIEGYINVDVRELPNVDVIADAEHLPFAKGELREIMSAHMLEHFPQEQLRRVLLPYWHGLLGAGGVLRAVVPDAEAMMREYSRGKYPYDDLREVFYGGQDYDGDFHYNMFTPGSLQALLEEAGFDDIDVVAEGRKNGQCYEFEITCVKPTT